MSPPELLTTQVDLSGLMRVLGEHLYSTRRVAVRELVQNAHDSCTRRRLESDAPFEPRISVRTNAAAGTLSIEDNGAGLTRRELIDYLATVGRGYTGVLRQKTGAEDLVGAFGLGFLSAYFVSDRVELFTTSFQAPDCGWHFSSKGGERFQLTETPARVVGTRVVLHLNAESRELADPTIARALLERYCGLLTIPIGFGDGEALNVTPPWRVAPHPSPLRRQKAELAFAARFERQFEPVCTLPVGDESSVVRGMLWIQDGWTFGTSDQRNISVYVRGMLISDDARELAPPWAGFAGGVLESDRLTPTASREDLQRDALWQSAAREVREALVAGLAELSRSQPAAWRRVLTRHSEQLLGAALCDERLFELLADELRVPTSEGDLTVSAIVERSGGRIHVSTGEQGGYEEVLFRALRVPVVAGVRYAALPFCRQYAETRRHTLVQLGTREGNEALFPAALVNKADSVSLCALLGTEGCDVVLTRFEPATLPAVLIPDREVALKRRVESDEADQRISQGVLSLVRMHTATIDGSISARLYVNLACPAIQALLRVREPARSHGAALIRALAELSSSRADEALDVDMTATLEAMTSALTALLGAE